MKNKIFILLFVAMLAGVFFWARQVGPRTAAPGGATSNITPPPSTPERHDSTTMADSSVAAPAAPSPALPTSGVVAAAPVAESIGENALFAKIPEGDLRKDLLKLRPEVRSRVLASIEQQQIPKEDFSSLRVSAEGDLYYVCNLEGQHGACAHTQGIPAVDEEEVVARADTSGVGEAPVPISSPPVRHSRPGASRVLYLDFNGHVITGTAWRNGTVTTFNARAFDTDGDVTTFSDAEQAIIIQVWERVAEDYAPFDVDVTTEEPATFTSTTGRALITRNTDVDGVAMPSSSAGGVAYLSVFGNSNYHTYYSPALVYHNNLGNSASSIAEATSHELGHNLGLSHDGQVASGAASAREYYGGHGTGDTSWGPLMGTGYGRNVSQWSKGEYYLANNTQDDLSIITNRLTLRTDDVGNTTAASTALVVTAGSFTGAGVLHTSTDVDVFSVALDAGRLTLSATGYRAASSTQGGNTDLKIELLDASGNLLASDDSATTTKCALPVVVTAGNYFVRVSPSSTGDPLGATPLGYTRYGCLGQYTLTGTVAASATVAPAFTTQPANQAVTIGAGVTFTAAAAGTPTPTYQWYFKGAAISSATSANYSIASTTTANNGNFHVVASSSAGTATSASAYLTVQVPAGITTQPASTSIPSTTTATLNVTATGVPTPTFQWYQGASGITTTPIYGASSASYTTPALTATTSYWVRVTNTLATVDSSTATVTVVPNVVPTISTQPVSQTVNAGTSVTMNVEANGTPRPSYQWYYNNASITNATGASYTIANVATANTGNYYVRVYNLAGDLNSSTVTLTVNAIPAITTQPTSISILSGNTAPLNVAASGTPTPTYQWYQGTSGTTTTPVSGATSTTYTTPALTATTSYWVRASNIAGSADSATATVTVQPEAAINIDASIQHQTIEGWGTNGYPPQFWNNTNYQVGLLDLDITHFRIRSDYAEFEPVNDDNDPNIFNWSGFPDDGSQHLYAMYNKLANDGIEPLPAPWTLPIWLAPNDRGYIYDTLAGLNEVAELMTAMVLKTKSIYGFELKYISMQNEPNGGVYVKYSPNQLRDLIKLVGAKFDENGIKTKIYAPDVWSAKVDLVPYYDAILNDTTCRKYLGALAYHTYGFEYNTQVASIEAIAEKAKQYNLPVWVTESGYITSGIDHNNFDQEMNLASRWQVFLTEGNANLLFTWAIFGADAMVVNGQPKKGYWVYKQFTAHIPAGSKRIESAVSDVDGVRVTAFVEENTKRFTIVMVNSNNSAINPLVVLQNIQLDSLDVRLTTETDNYASLARIPISDNSFTPALAARSITTFTGIYSTVPDTYTAWVAGNFTAAEQANAAISGPLADPDRCGLTNLARYAFGLAARGPVANPIALGTATVGGAQYLTLTFPRRTVATGLSYIVESSSDLITWAQVSTFAPDATPTVTAQDSVAMGAATRRFLRVRVTQL